jgi:hypothetical protein
MTTIYTTTTIHTANQQQLHTRQEQHFHTRQEQHFHTRQKQQLHTREGKVTFAFVKEIMKDLEHKMCTVF